MTERDLLRKQFIDRCGWAGATIEPLVADASFRRYFRLNGNGVSAMVMDAPPDKGEDVRPFLLVDRHLRALGLTAPEILDSDDDTGFLLLEDFGDATFTRLLAAGHDEADLYRLATDVLAHLHTHPDASGIAVGTYDPELMIDKACLFIDWYLPDLTGHPAPEECRAGFTAAWHSIFESLPPPQVSLVLRDYHFDNLMRLDGRAGVAACGLLDFQDALKGPAAYDLATLLVNERRDVPADIAHTMLERYLRSVPVNDGFLPWYNACALQRQVRVMGIFTRLSNRDGKHGYRAHLPRLTRHLLASLQTREAAPLAAWAERWLPPLSLR